MRFSERYGYKPVREIIQKESMDDTLKNKLWSTLYSKIFIYYNHGDYKYRLFEPLMKKVWVNFFRLPIDELPPTSKLIHFIKSHLFEKEWYEFYDFIEFILSNENSIYDGYTVIFDHFSFIRDINLVLESELAAYRIINNQITEITSEQEIQSIEEALANTNPYSGVQQHLNQALKLMSDRQNPDYRNSMKESISAVEGICRIISGDKNDTFKKAIAKIETKYQLHSSLKEGFNKLYTYTSDGDGIRHAMLEESNLSYIDAKFMLVACTNFINYLIEKTKASN